VTPSSTEETASFMTLAFNRLRRRAGAIRFSKPQDMDAEQRAQCRSD
jgi:hypothetical protein